MIWTDAAENILRKEKKGINYKELARKIIKADLVETDSKTPHITLHATISLDIKSREDRGLPARFTLERGEVALAKWEKTNQETNVLEQARKFRDTAKSELLKKLRLLSGDKFESFIEALLIKMGYKDVDLRGGTGDEGIDLLCQMSQGINQVKTAVQAKCKQPNNKVGPNAVRLLRDVLPKYKCSQGVLITTSSFASETEMAANEEGRPPIILIDGDKLAELALEHEVGIKSQPMKIYSVDLNFDLFK